MSFEEYIKEQYAVDLAGCFEEEDIAEKLSAVTNDDLDVIVQAYTDACEENGWLYDAPSSLDQYLS